MEQSKVINLVIVSPAFKYTVPRSNTEVVGKRVGRSKRNIFGPTLRCGKRVTIEKQTNLVMDLP